MKFATTAAPVSCFQTKLGWFAVVGKEGRLHRVVIGAPSKAAANEYWQSRPDAPTDFVSDDWYPDCRLSLTAYAAGEQVDLDQFCCDLTELTPFQQAVLNHVRGIPYGEVRTYGQIAAELGRPKAARAIGGAMSRNRIPLIIPCHRVVGVNENLTGFTAPRGLDLKRELLEMEQTANIVHS